MIPWIFTALSTFGSWLCATENMLWCWRIWTASNFYFFIHDLCIHEWAQAVSVLVNLFFSLYGWWQEEINKQTRL
jgi:hypothetical protein